MACKEVKPVDQFAIKDRKIGLRNSWCLACHSTYRKARYRNDPDKERERIEARRVENKRRFRELKASLSCERCGEDHPATLHFHHNDPTQKDFGLAAAVRDFGWKRIEAEIAKCSVICANCHAKEHHGNLFEP